MEVYENIKFIRQFKSLSQEQMAEKLDMSLNGYAKIEQGKVDINLSRDQARCQHELEKANLIIEQKDKEIVYLKEIIELVKKQR